ncbi:hypothetical protein PoB_005381500 [Plakobranchus ocellatus]|uniref:Uncharacterized protein n=1 Tax=Plakobranchus ocellatus TaxID=259542 RepID=A0AAV4C3R5_9GAST|nr:hypothetical protein PoB_005381500 [Plakobranchus ocellatus]
MHGTTLVVLKLLLGVIGAQQPTPTVKPKPTVTIVTNSSSHLCSEQFLVVGEDFVTFELDLSGNNSDYTYSEFDWPRFRFNELITENGTTKVARDRPICLPFDLPQNGFCVKRDIFNTTGCSCEVVGVQVYRVKVVYRIEDVKETRGRIVFVWPSVPLPFTISYNLPGIRSE